LHNGITANDQLSAVCPELVESSKVANLPNPHNSIHDALRFASRMPEPQKLIRAMNFAEWAESWASPDALSDSTLTHGG